jgi:hypothetical protein
LEFVHGEGALAAKRQRLEAIRCQMTVSALLMIVRVFARAFLFGPIAEEAIRLKKPTLRMSGSATSHRVVRRMRAAGASVRISASNAGNRAPSARSHLLSRMTSPRQSWLRAALLSKSSRQKLAASATVTIESSRTRSRNSERRNVSATGSGSATPVVSTTK